RTSGYKCSGGRQPAGGLKAAATLRMFPSREAFKRPDEDQTRRKIRLLLGSPYCRPESEALRLHRRPRRHPRSGGSQRACRRRDEQARRPHGRRNRCGARADDRFLGAWCPAIVSRSRKIDRTQSARYVQRADTICYATKENQDAARVLASDPEIDLILVVGGKKSANTKHLWEICREAKRSYLIQGADDLQRDWFQGVAVVGVTAGSSTPDYVIDEVEERIATF